MAAELDFTGKNLETITQEEIARILNVAMDDDEWHTPSASDIKINTQTNRCVYGYCNISKHNTYHDIEHWFNINANTVKIWKEEYVRDKANKSLFRPIYNLAKLSRILNTLCSDNPAQP